MIWLTGLSAGIFYLSFPGIFSPCGIPFLAWGFLWPFLWVLRQRSFMSRIGYGAVWGLVAYGFLVRWLFPVTVAGYFLFVLGLALQGVFFAVLFRSYALKQASRGDLFYLVYIPSAWVVSEYVRNAVLGGFTWSLGHAFAGHPSLIQSASWGGVYAVSWIIVFVNTAIFLAVQEKRVFSRLKYVMYAFLMLLVNYWGGMRAYVMPAPVLQDPWRVALLQPNITREEKGDASRYDENIRRHTALVEQDAMLEGSHVVIWPETAFPDDLLTDLVWRGRLEELARQKKVDMVIGSALLRNGYDINAALLLTRDGVWKDSYEKRRLVPFTEQPVTLPWFKLAAEKFGLRGYHFIAGEKPPVMLLRRSMKAGEKSVLMGLAICSEEAYPAHFREIARQGAAFVVVMLNDGWFKMPEALRVHAYHGIFRAVETGLPVLRAANTGWTVGFNGHGGQIRTISKTVLPVQQAGVVVCDVPGRQPLSFYTRFGNIFAQACGVFVIIVAGMDVRRWRGRRKRNGYVRV